MPTFRRPIRISSSKVAIRLASHQGPTSSIKIAKTESAARRIFAVPRRIPVSLRGSLTPPASVALTLPLPPSINHQYATVNGRRLLSSAGRTYKAQVEQLVWLKLLGASRRSELLSGLQSSTLALTIRFYFSSALRRDVDGGLKIAQDALCEGLGVNDNRIIETHLYKYVDKSNPRIEVTLQTTR